MKGYNPDEVDNYIMSELQSNRTYRNEAQGTNDVIDNTLDKIVSVYSGFTRIK